MDDEGKLLLIRGRRKKLLLGAAGLLFLAVGMLVSPARDSSQPTAAVPPEPAAPLLEEQLRERKVAIEVSPAARAFLAEKGYEPVFGARPLARVLQAELRDPLADDLLFGRLVKGGRVRVDCAEGKLGFVVEAA